MTGQKLYYWYVVVSAVKSVLTFMAKVISKSLFVKQTLIDYYTHLYKKIPPALNSGSEKAGDFFLV